MQTPVQASKVDKLLEMILRTSGLSLTYDLVVKQSGEPSLLVEFTGADAPMLVARNAELLLALEHIAAKTLRLEPEQHDLIYFESSGFKVNRDRNLQRAAAAAIAQVRTTGQPFAFPPMSSRERRLLHLLLAPNGLHTASAGEGPQRHLVLHPTAPAKTRTTDQHG